MCQRKMFLIAYDVADSKRLRRVFRIMCDYATPVQLSVFEACLTGNELQALIQALEDVIDERADSIRCYRLSKAALCVDLGQGPRGEAILV